MGHKKKDITDSDDKRKGKKFGLVGSVFKFFYGSIFHTELAKINHALIKANELAPDSYFMRLLFKNRILWLIASSPSIINIFLLFTYFKHENTLVTEITSAIQLITRALGSKNPDLLLQLSFSDNFVFYLGMLSAQIIGLTTLAWIFMGIIKRINPIIKKSIELKEYCLSKGYSEENDDLFLVCKAGLLAQVSKGSGDDLFKDQYLWRHLNKIPKDPVESPKDRSIVFIGNGFELQKYEFKIT